MTATPCNSPALAYNSSQAPEKRQHERPPLPVSEVFSCLKSARILGCQSPMLGIGGMRDSQDRAPLSCVVSQTRQFPALKPVQSF